MVYPDAPWTTCFPHIACKPYGEWRKYMVENSDDSVSRMVLEDVRLIHKCRSIKQVEALVPIVLKKWRDHKQVELARVVEKEYFSEPWNVWYCTAGGHPGVCPSSQPIEAYNKSTRLPRMVNLCS